VANARGEAERICGELRTRLGEELGLIEKSCYRFCWIVDYPMYEYDEQAKKIDFSHNPFSMPQGGLEALENRDLALQSPELRQRFEAIVRRLLEDS